MQNINASSLSITEQEIRDALIGWLKGRIDSNAHLQEELRLERGSARIDVAVIGQSLIGYEIKSDADTFARFSNQIHAYNRVFDEIHLVCGPSHVEAALLAIPSWWGLSVAKRDQEKICLELVRSAGLNSRQDSFSLASLLWKEEALAMIKEDAIDFPKRASSHTLWEYIATSFPLETIKNFVTNTLLKRAITVN